MDEIALKKMIDEYHAKQPTSGTYAIDEEEGHALQLLCIAIGREDLFYG